MTANKKFVYGFLIAVLIFPGLEASNSKSNNHTQNSHGKTSSKILSMINKGIDAIKKGMDVVLEIPKFFERYLSFSQIKPPKGENPEIKKLRDKIAENEKKLTKFQLKQDTEDAKAIYRENIKIVHKLAKKLNNTRIDNWEKLYEKELMDMEYLNIKNFRPFHDFLEDLLEIENAKPLSKDEAERMKRVANLRDDIYQIWNVLKIYENQTETNSQNVKKQVDRAVQKFHKLAMEMNREGMLTNNAYVQFKHRAGQERQDLKSIAFDVGKVLDEFETDPKANIIMTMSKILKLMKLNLISYLSIDFLEGKNKETRIEEANDLLHYLKKTISLTFRGMYRAVPDGRRFANITESVNSSHDIMSSIQDMSFYIKKIKEYYDEIYWNGAKNKRKKEEDMRSGRTDYDNLLETGHNLANLHYFSMDNTRELEGKGRKLINELVSEIQNLARLMHINKFFDKIDWHGANHRNEAINKKKKEEDMKSGSGHDVEPGDNLPNLFYYSNAKARVVEHSSRKLIDKAVSAIRNLGKILHINTMGVYANRIETAVKKGSIDADKLSKVLEIVESAKKQVSAKIGERPIDFYVIKLKKISSTIPAWIVLLWLIPALTKFTTPNIVRPLLQTVWNIADRRTVNGFDDLEEEVDDIINQIKDHGGKQNELEKDLMELKTSIDKFIWRNIGLM